MAKKISKKDTPHASRSRKLSTVTDSTSDLLISKVAPPTPSASESDEGSKIKAFGTTLTHIAKFVTFWNYVKSHDTQDYLQAWQSAGLGNGNHAKGFLDRVAAGFHRGHFFTKKNSTLEINHDQQPFVEELERLVSKLGRYLASPTGIPTIRFGVGHSVAMSLGPAILKSVRIKHSGFEVELIIGDTDRLLPQLHKGQLDCLLGVLPANVATEGKTYADIPIAPALIAPYSHPVARRFRSSGIESISEDLLADPPDGKWGVHIFESESLKHPRRFLPRWDLIHFLPQPNFAAINELVAGGNDLGITLPQFLTNSQQLAVQVIPIHVREKPRLQLLSCENLCREHFDLMNDATEGTFGKRLDGLLQVARELANQQCSKMKYNSEKIQFRFFAQVRLPARDGEKSGSNRWVRGIMTSHSRVDNKLSGEAILLETVPENDDDKVITYHRVFSLKGVLQRIESSEGEWKEIIAFHVVDEGVEPFKINGVDYKGAPAGEILSATFVRHSTGGPSFGRWHGWNPKHGAQVIGDLLIDDPKKPLDSNKITTGYLNSICGQHRRMCRHPK